MSRYSNTFETNLLPGEIDSVVRAYLESEKFEYVNYKGENVWKKGEGFFTYPQYIKVSAANGSLTVEAFLKYPILPAVSVGEIAPKGFVAFPVKAKLKDRVSQLEYRLQNAAHEKYKASQQPSSDEA